MKASHNVKKNTQVLRDTLLHTHPYVLERPKRFVESAFTPVSKPRVESVVQPGAPLPNLGNISVGAISKPVSDRYQEGLLAGKKEGIQIGKAEAKLAYEHSMATERQQVLDNAVQEGLQQALLMAQEQMQIQVQDQVHKQVQAKLNELRQATDEKLAYLEKLCAGIPVELEKCISNSEDDMLEICFSVICRMLGQTATTREGILSMIKLHSKEFIDGALQIGLHPDDLKTLQSEVKQRTAGEFNTTENFIDSAHVKLIPDADISLGGVIFRSQKMSLDARIETQLHAIKETLLQVRYRADLDRQCNL